jgi:KDO2-lipid IV(A) lauroyltransferase
MMFVLIYHLIGYRRKVVFANLSSCFPEKSKNEIRLLEIKFFHHLCDISLESIKGFSMSPEELVKRHRILNPELADFYFNKGMSVISLPAHYNNWEWGSMSPGLQMLYPIVAFYKPMSNTQTDSFVKTHRARFNTRLASIGETALTFNVLSSLPHTYIMAADQSPSNVEDAFWLDFLNHDSAWLHGPEKYARKYEWPVIYVDIQKVKRGLYELKLVLLTDNPASLPDGEITRLYAQHLEKSILQEPAYWLWSHRRWKHKRERD